MSWFAPLVEVVTSHWASTGKAYNLARAKPALQSKHVDLEAHLNGRKLKDAVQEDATAELRVIRNPARPLTWGLIPRNALTPADVAELFSVSPTEKPKPKEAGIRFSKGVWMAFSKPLEKGNRRFLELGGRSWVHDIPEDGALPSSGLEVPTEYIWAQSDELIPSDNRDQDIVANIRRWAEDKGVDLALLSGGANLKRSQSDDGQGFKSYLDVSSLSQADKARILIPLDLVEKISLRR